MDHQLQNGGCKFTLFSNLDNQNEGRTKMRKSQEHYNTLFLSFLFFLFSSPFLPFFLSLFHFRVTLLSSKKKIFQHLFFFSQFAKKISNLFSLFSLGFYRRRWSVKGLKGDGKGGWLQVIGWLQGEADNKGAGSMGEKWEMGWVEWFGCER